MKLYQHVLHMHSKYWILNSPIFFLVSHCEPKPKFSHMDNMRQYGIKENEHVAFAENCLKKLDTKALCKEIVSFMNSRDGGVIYVGVSTAGKILIF